MAATKKSTKPAKSTASRTASRAKSKPAARARRPAARSASPTRATPETLRLKAAAPSLTVNDLEKSLAFYRDVAGFTVKELWEENGKLLGVNLLAGNVDLFIGQDDWKKGRDRQKGLGLRIICTTVQDVDVLARQMKAKGIGLDQEPQDEDWGRNFAFTDPDGFKFSIVNQKKR